MTWWKALFRHSRRPIVRPRPGRRNLGFDTLEERATPALTSLVSVSLPISAGDGDSFTTASSGATFSANGQFAVFASDASNLVAGDTNGVTDIFVADLTTGVIELISVDENGVQADGPSFYPSISDDGNLVAFQSFATNLLGDLTPVAHIFVKNRATGEVILVDATSGGEEATNPSSEPAISGNGTFVVFSSDADNLTFDDHDPTTDIFRKNIVSGDIVLVSKTSAGAKGTGNSFSPAISADGRYVAFASDANNLVGGDLNTSTDIYRKDVDGVGGEGAGAIVFVSTASGAIESDGALGNDDSTQPQISADGNVVLFVSTATNLVVGDTNNAADLFVKDLTTRQTQRVNLSETGTPLTLDSGSPSLSADGTVVAFSTSGDSVVTGDTNGLTDVFVRDLDDSTTVRVTLAFGDFGRLAGDGSAILYQTGAGSPSVGDNNENEDVYVYNFGADTTALVSHGATFTTGADAIAVVPQTGVQVSGDGSRVVFISAASNIVEGGNPTQAAHVYVRDRNLGVTVRVSESTVGGPGNGDSATSAISADGSMVAFSSTADNLVDGDSNDFGDIILADFNAGSLRIISTAGGEQANNHSSNPVFSGNGRYLIFLTQATNLFDDNAPGAVDVARADLVTGEIRLVSCDLDGNQSPASFIRGLSISDDGRYITFASDADGLALGDEDGLYDVFVKDMDTGELTIVSKRSDDGTLADGDSYDPVISGNGLFVAFTSDATNLDESDSNGVSDVYLSEWQTGASGVVFRVSVLPDNSEANGASGQASIDRSGRHIAFATVATNFVEGDTNNSTDLFVKDAMTGQVFLVSQSTAGLRADADSAFPSISADGRTVAYGSVASTLDPIDVNGLQDVFATLVDAAPAVELSGDRTLSEGESLALTATANESGLTYAWDLNGDGSFDVSGASLSLDYASLQALGIGDGPSTVTATLRVTDSFGDSDFLFDLTFENIAPTPAIGLVSVGAIEGSLASFTASATDPSDADTLAGFTWQWTATLDGNVIATGTSSGFSFLLPDNGHYTVTLVAVDKDGGSQDTTHTFDVANGVPVPNITQTTAGSFEGETVSFQASATDPGPDDTSAGFTFDWVVTLDGTEVDAGNGPTFTFDLVDDGVYIVTLTATDKDGGSAQTPFSFLVGNVLPTPAIAPQTVGINEGSSATFLGSATDAGQFDTTAGFTFSWTALLDGSPVANGSGPSFTFPLDDNGSYTVTLVATDKDGGGSSTSFPFSVNNLAPTAIITPGPFTAVEGQSVNLFGSATDAPADTTAGFVFNWSVTRDGETVFTSTTANFTLPFADDGIYLATLTVTDQDGASDDESYPIIVANLVPTVTTNAPAGGVEGTPIAFTPTAIDAGILDTSFTFAWSVTKNGAPYASGAGSVNFTPNDNANYVVSITATDKDGGESLPATATIVVTNAPPAFTLAPTATVDANTLYSLNLAATDPGSADTVSWSINWGDGSAVQTVSGFSVTVSHVYSVAAVRTISITVTDDDDGSTNHTQTLTVNAESGTTGPTIAIDGNASVPVNDIYSLLLGPIDNPDELTVTGFRIDWGDGQFVEDVGTPPSPFPHTYETVGERTIIVSLLNGSTPYPNPQTKTITVTSVVTLTAPAAVDEGSPFTLDIGAGAESATAYSVNWGDGTSSGSDSGPPPSSLVHTYGNGPASRTITLTITDEEGTRVVGSTTIVVNNVGPDVDAGDDETITSATLSRAGTFIDPGTDSWSATVDYGDGSGPQNLVLTGKTFTLNHTYAVDGVYPVTVTITDGVQSGSDIFQLTVNAVPNTAPIINLATTASLTAGETLTLNGSFADPDEDSWTATVNYGEPGGVAETLVLTGKNFSLSHQYNTAGPFVITVVIDDGGGSPSTAMVNVTVNEVPPPNTAPQITVAPTATIRQDQHLSLTGSFTDPDTNVWDATVNYGDGTGDQPLALTANKTFTLDHQYASTGPFTVTITVTDGTDEDEETVAVTVTAANNAPDFTLTTPTAISEGGSVVFSGSFTDPDEGNTWSAKVNYGLGGGDEDLALTGKSFSIDRVYPQDGTFTLTIKISDGITTTEKSVTVTVNNVAPTVSAPGGDVTLITGHSLTRPGSFIDPGADTWTASVNYGDGTAVQTLVLTNKTFALDHQYTKAGTFTVTVTVNDDDGPGTTSFVVTSSVASVVIALPPSTIAERSANDAEVGTLSITDEPYLTANGTFSLADDAGGRFKVVGNKVLVADTTKIDFETATSHTITVHFEKDGQSPENKTFTITVGNADEGTDVVGRDPVTGTFTIGKTLGGQFTQIDTGISFDPQRSWTDYWVADFDGDGNDDIIARDANNSEFLVAKQNAAGTSFQVPLSWGQWSGPNWVDVMFIDANGDGKWDIVGRNPTSGEWWICLTNTTGDGGITRMVGQWDPTISWVDARAADVNKDGRVDIVARKAGTGEIHVAFNHANPAAPGVNVKFDNGNGPFTILSDGNSSGTVWVDFMLHDFNGDLVPDFAGRVLATGVWWVNLGNNGGSPDPSTDWGTWIDGSGVVGGPFVNVFPLDLGGDGKYDLIGRRPGDSRWFVAKSGTKFAIKVVNSPGKPEDYSQFVTGDFNGDGSEDVAGYRLDGTWDVGIWREETQTFDYSLFTDDWLEGRIGVRSGRIRK